MLFIVSLSMLFLASLIDLLLLLWLLWLLLVFLLIPLLFLFLFFFFLYFFFFFFFLLSSSSFSSYSFSFFLYILFLRSSSSVLFLHPPSDSSSLWNEVHSFYKSSSSVVTGFNYRHLRRFGDFCELKDSVRLSGKEALLVGDLNTESQTVDHSNRQNMTLCCNLS